MESEAVQFTSTLTKGGFTRKFDSDYSGAITRRRGKNAGVKLTITPLGSLPFPELAAPLDEVEAIIQGVLVNNDVLTINNIGHTGVTTNDQVEACDQSPILVLTVFLQTGASVNTLAVQGVNTLLFPELFGTTSITLIQVVASEDQQHSDKEVAAATGGDAQIEEVAIEITIPVSEANPAVPFTLVYREMERT